jgi:parallel beta-helix repeat protein
MPHKQRGQCSNAKKFAIMLSLIFLTGIVGATITEAAILYVDKDSPCPGAGTTGVPYCSIQNAFNAVDPGDTIRIRNAASPYDQNAIARRSGTASSPIILEPDSGHNPIIRFTGKGFQAAAIQLQDVDYWIVRNLTFNGTNTYSSRYALWIRVVNRNVTGNQVTGNSFLNWGGSESQAVATAALAITGLLSGSYSPRNTVVSGNKFDGNRLMSIFTLRASNTVIQNNEIKNARAGRDSTGVVNCIGVHTTNYGQSVVIRNNSFHDWQEHRTVTLTNQGHAIWAGIWADVNEDKGQVLRNIFYNIDQNKSSGSNPLGSSQGSYAVLLESRCDYWLVQENLVYNIGQCGLRNGSGSTGDANYNKYLNNTIYSCGLFGIYYVRGYGTTIKNNILFDNGQAQISFSSTAISQGPHVLDYNDYHDLATAGGKVGKWGSYSVLNFSSWKSQCKGDSHAKNANPLFVSLSSYDFHLSSSSSCKDAGEYGVNMGAYLTP